MLVDKTDLVLALFYDSAQPDKNGSVSVYTDFQVVLLFPKF